MVLWFRFAQRNMFRNVRRTMLTAATVVAGCALMTLALSWMAGVFNTIIADYVAMSGQIRLVDADFAARESLQPLYENIEQTGPLIKSLKEIPGIIDAEPRIATGVVLAKGEEIGDTFGLVIGASDTYFRKYLRGPEKLVQGTWLTGAEKEVVVGRKLASQLNAQLGDEILLLGQSQSGSMSPITGKLVGIAGGDSVMDMQVFIPLAEARWMTDIPEGSLEVLLWTDARQRFELATLAQTLRSHLNMKELSVQAWFERDPWASGLAVMEGVQKFIQVLVVFVTALAIFNTMTMSVLERTTEIGVLRAMGMTRLLTIALFLVEGLSIGLLGGIVGTLLGSIPAWYLERTGVNLGEDLAERVGDFPLKAVVYADLSPEIMLQSMKLGLVIAAVGALLPALRASAIKPVTAMRARR